MMACIYRGGENFCVIPGHKLYGAAKSEEAERKWIEKEDKKKRREFGEDVPYEDEFIEIQKKLAEKLEKE